MHITHIEHTAQDARDLVTYIADDIPFGLVLRSQEDGTDTVRTLVLTDLDPSDRFVLQCLVNELSLIEGLYVFTDKNGTHGEVLEPIEFIRWVSQPCTGQHYDGHESVYATQHARLLALLSGQSVWHIHDPKSGIDVVCPNQSDIDITFQTLKETYLIDPRHPGVVRTDLRDGMLVYTNERLTETIVYGTEPVS